jgi:hypothetical protein
MLNRRVMSALYIVAILIVIVASPAFAGSEHSGKTQRAWQATSQVWRPAPIWYRSRPERSVRDQATAELAERLMPR